MNISQLKQYINSSNIHYLNILMDQNTNQASQMPQVRSSIKINLSDEEQEDQVRSSYNRQTFGAYKYKGRVSSRQVTSSQVLDQGNAQQVNQQSSMTGRIYTPYTTTINHRHSRIQSGSGVVVPQSVQAPQTFHPMTPVDQKKNNKALPSALVRNLSNNLQSSFNNQNQNQRISSLQSSPNADQRFSYTHEPAGMMRQGYNLGNDDDIQITSSFMPLKPNVIVEDNQIYNGESQVTVNHGYNAQFLNHPNDDNNYSDNQHIQEEQKQVESVETQEDKYEIDDDEDARAREQFYTSLGNPVNQLDADIKDTIDDDENPVPSNRQFILG